ncbi:MAG: 30S ribosomal protein S9 [Sphingobacteriales bacterium]|nr:MAG: 30S ribosomal protein S9 [Sphingobacteriales bacterium]
MAYTNATGRRKTAIARIYLEAGSGNITINGKKYDEYFPAKLRQFVIEQPLDVTTSLGTYDIKINVKGGGLTGQAEAIRLGIARALVKENADVKPSLKEKGFLTRDPRMVERKKFGHKKARKSFQFSKR